jgi:predicted ribosome quality control (RQC) complex YloA/Tae2 family protein
MDPATIGFLISIAPTVLDLLFGQGHIKESLRQQRYPLENMYGYGLEGYGMYGQGFHYPRRRRKIPTVETYYPPEAQPKLIRAAVFNRAVAAKNPWLQFLHIEKYFEQIRNLLKKAAEEYRKENPITEKDEKSLRQQLTKLQAELNILQNEAANKSLAEEFTKRYPGADYSKTIQEKIAKLEKEINRIHQSLPVGEVQLLAPK